MITESTLESTDAVKQDESGLDRATSVDVATHELAEHKDLARFAVEVHTLLTSSGYQETAVKLLLCEAPKRFDFVVGAAEVPDIKDRVRRVAMLLQSDNSPLNNPLLCASTRDDVMLIWADSDSRFGAGPNDAFDPQGVGATIFRLAVDTHASKIRDPLKNRLAQAVERTQPRTTEINFFASLLIKGNDTNLTAIDTLTTFAEMACRTADPAATVKLGEYISKASKSMVSKVERSNLQVANLERGASRMSASLGAVEAKSAENLAHVRAKFKTEVTRLQGDIARRVQAFATRTGSFDVQINNGDPEHLQAIVGFPETRPKTRPKTPQAEVLFESPTN